jgi:dihydropyrimidinase
MKQLLINCRLWRDKAFTKSDIIIEDGIVTAIGKDLFDTYSEVIDCRGAYLIPGLVDMHVHIGEKTGGLTLADNWKSLSDLAEKSGITAIGAFVTEQPVNGDKKTLSEQFRHVQEISGKDFKGHVHWHLTPDISEVKDVYPLLKEGCDLKFYTTYKSSGLFKSYEEIGRWMSELTDIKPLMLIHCEDDDIVSSMSAFHPFHHPFDHTKRRPEKAEIKAVEKVLDLAVRHNYPMHIVHVSSPQSAVLIKEAGKIAPVTCETAAHYLLLNELYLQRDDGHRWICTPPLRSEKSRGEMVELLQDSVFEAIATDHCPFKTMDKDRFKNQPEQVPSGLAGMGAALPVLYENLVKTGKITMDELMPLLIDNPARIMKLPEEMYNINQGYGLPIYCIDDKLTKKKQILPSFSDTHNPWIDQKTSLELRRIT